MGDAATPYDADRITVLEWPAAVRARPGMYVGSTTRRGLHHLVFEGVEWALEEVLAGRAERVDVTLTPDDGVRVGCDGPGLPVAAAPHERAAGQPTLEELLTRMSPWPPPRGRDSTTSSPFALGPCVTNALSAHLTAEVRRAGTRWVQEYAYGVAAAPPTAAGPAQGSGTTLAFRPDPAVFETTEVSFTQLAARFHELAALDRRLTLTLTDERPPGPPPSLRFHCPGGVRDLVTYLDTRDGAAPVHPDVIAFEAHDPAMGGTVEVALRWHADPAPTIRGYANSTPLRDGTHEAGLRDGLAAALALTTEEVTTGLTAVVSVKLDAPVFEGATRTTLGNPEARAAVAGATRTHLPAWLSAHPAQAAAILTRLSPPTPTPYAGG